jgi:putative lipoic acid-binding regulatory protein|tara:strand:- start:134 stop:406 length:273 start_codon:yes stop_codon:yes gene_type:complete
MANKEEESLIDFPCYFPIKVMGETVDNFSLLVMQVIKKYDESFNETAIEIKGSSEGKYISLTCNIYVTSKKQLDEIYIELSGLSITKFVL